jgi:hypothetical protein
MSLPLKRQRILVEDKWMLAQSFGDYCTKSLYKQNKEFKRDCKFLVKISTQEFINDKDYYEMIYLIEKYSQKGVNNV